MSGPWRRSPAPLVTTLTLLLAGCTGASPEPAPGPAPSSPSTPLASYDTGSVSVARAPYCDRVPDSATAEALGEAPRSSAAYDNGDAVTVAGGKKDVVHEYGCTWSAGPTRVRTWLFAPPITGQRARDLVKQARTMTGCDHDEQAPGFGTPSVALVCTDGPETSVAYRGLFGDAWLVCEVTGRDTTEELSARADRWCVQVVEAVRAD